MEAHYNYSSQCDFFQVLHILLRPCYGFPLSFCWRRVIRTEVFPNPHTPVIMPNRSSTGQALFFFITYPKGMTHFNDGVIGSDACVRLADEKSDGVESYFFPLGQVRSAHSLIPWSAAPLISPLLLLERSGRAGVCSELLCKPVFLGGCSVSSWKGRSAERSGPERECGENVAATPLPLFCCPLRHRHGLTHRPTGKGNCSQRKKWTQGRYG